MKNKIAAGIMLLAGSIAVVVCLINNASIDTMLLSVFLSMFIFMIIGFAVQGIIDKMNKEAQERLDAEAQKKREEEARLKAEKEEADRLAQEEEIKKQLIQREADNVDSVIAAGADAKESKKKDFIF